MILTFCGCGLTIFIYFYVLMGLIANIDFNPPMRGIQPPPPSAVSPKGDSAVSPSAERPIRHGWRVGPPYRLSDMGGRRGSRRRRGS